MSRVLYYLVIKPLSYVPLSVLYLLSNGISFLFFYLIPYRKKVVTNNLTNSFPDKSQSEIKNITRRFYSHLTDLIVEGVKLFSISYKESLTRFKVNNPELVNAFYEQGKSVILVGAHYNNWEMLAMGIDQQIQHQAVGIYAKLENQFFNDKFLSSRTKYGLQMITTKETAPYFINGFEKPTLTIFGSDQSPTYNKSVYWTHFLNQETAVASGTERFAKKYDIPVIFGVINKDKRGHYSLDLEVLTDTPTEHPDGWISKKFTQRIEDQIKADPSYWLWTHKRWKRKREEHESFI